MSYLNIKLIGCTLLLHVLVFSSCTVQLVADYDAELSAEIVEAAKEVDAYYSDLISITNDEGVNAFDDTLTKGYFIKKYKSIDNRLYGIMLKNQSKELNKGSSEISKSILEKFWRTYNGDLGVKKVLLELHRKNFTRNFEALLKAELAKQTNENN